MVQRGRCTYYKSLAAQEDILPQVVAIEEELLQMQVALGEDVLKSGECVAWRVESVDDKHMMQRVCHDSHIRVAVLCHHRRAVRESLVVILWFVASLEKEGRSG